MVDLTNLKVGDMVHLRCGGSIVVGDDMYRHTEWTFISGVFYLTDTGQVKNAGNKSPFDIISITPKPEPKRIKGWLNIFDKGTTGSLRPTREEAEDAIVGKVIPRIACVYIDVAEGEGIENGK